jgi:hypothetical protein
VRLCARLVLGGVLGGLVVASCGNDHQHPPFASGTCAEPPCSTPISHGGGVVDAGRSADAGLDAPNNRG